MQLNRRNFLMTSLAAGTLVSVPLVICTAPSRKISYKKLDQVIAQPVFKKELFDFPVIRYS